MAVQPIPTGIIPLLMDVTGGQIVQCDLTLDKAAPTAQTVHLTTSRRDVFSGFPSLVTVPIGKNSLTIPLITRSVATITIVTITATCNGQSKTTSLTIKPGGPPPGGPTPIT